MIKYSICIATFIKRFNEYFKPLLFTIKRIRPDIEIIVVINGEHNQKFDNKYRQDILEFISNFDNIYPIMFPQQRSCSKLWNTALWNASNHLCLRIDDDVTILEGFFEQLESIIVNEQRSFKINGSWSHTFLNRLEVNDIGWFDERFLGGGEEDGDFEWRYENKLHRPFMNISGFNIINHWDKVNFEECLVGHRKIYGKRSKFNVEFRDQKYKKDDNGKTFGIMGGPWIEIDPTPNQYPNEYFYWNNKDKL